MQRCTDVTGSTRSPAPAGSRLGTKMHRSLSPAESVAEGAREAFRSLEPPRQWVARQASGHDFAGRHGRADELSNRARC